MIPLRRELRYWISDRQLSPHSRVLQSRDVLSPDHVLVIARGGCRTTRLFHRYMSHTYFHECPRVLMNHPSCAALSEPERLRAGSAQRGARRARALFVEHALRSGSLISTSARNRMPVPDVVPRCPDMCCAGLVSSWDRSERSTIILARVLLCLFDIPVAFQHHKTTITIGVFWHYWC